MVEVDSPAPRLRHHNVRPGEAHVDALPGAALAVLGAEDDCGEQSGARPGLAVVSLRVTHRQTVGALGSLRGGGVVPTPRLAEAGLAVAAVGGLASGVGGANSRHANIAVAVSLTTSGF